MNPRLRTSSFVLAVPATVAPGLALCYHDSGRGRRPLLAASPSARTRAVVLLPGSDSGCVARGLTTAPRRQRSEMDARGATPSALDSRVWGQQPEMRVMGLDVGDKTVGVAISDELEICASPRTVLPRDGREWAAVVRLAEAEAVGEIVVGMPISLSGQSGPQAEKVARFIRTLQARVGVPVREWDERLSTVEAERVLLAADASRGRRRQVIDKLAATLILQSYLDWKGSAQP
jgi:putative holliday junction resolvase